jgi:hypothetical protein
MAPDELRLIAPRLARQARARVDHPGGEAQTARVFDEGDAEAAEGVLLQRALDRIAPAGGEQCVGMQKHDRVVLRGLRAAIELARAHPLAGDDCRSAFPRDLDGPIAAPAVRDDDLGGASRECGLDRRRDGGFLVEGRNDHAHRHGGDANVLP